MATLAYIRVSTDKQDLDNQRHGVIEYAKKHSLEPLTFFEDTVSGKKNWRDRDLGKLIEQSNKGDVLLVADISRLARSTLQVLEVLQEAAKKELAVHVAKSNMVMDGSLSRITAVILGLVAEIEREFISARTTEALADKSKAHYLVTGDKRAGILSLLSLGQTQIVTASVFCEKLL
jgi:DNA invertase Pin-like site-specific DNA recombinase